MGYSWAKSKSMSKALGPSCLGLGRDFKREGQGVCEMGPVLDWASPDATSFPFILLHQMFLTELD